MAISKKAAPGSSTLPVHHPPYFQMISEALTSLKDRKGSSQPAIAKYLEDKYTKQTLPSNYKKILSVQLKKLVNSEKLLKIKNSYKIPGSTRTDNKIRAEKYEKKGKKAAPAAKMKLLSEVKTPEALKKGSGAARGRKGLSDVKGSVTGGRTKRLSEVNTPEALKKRKGGG